MEQKRKNYYEEFDEDNIKGVKKFNKILSGFTKTISITSITIAIAIILYAFFTIYVLTYIFFPHGNMPKELEEIYNEKFEIIEEKIDEKGKKIYTLSPKDNKDIQFTAYDESKLRLDNDYREQALKYYIEHCEDKQLIEDFHIEEGSYSYKNVEFLTYSVQIEVNNYEEIEEKVTKMYQLAKYIHSKNERFDGVIGLEPTNPALKYRVMFMINCNTQSSLEEEIERAKQEYKKRLEEYKVEEKKFNKI